MSRASYLLYVLHCSHYLQPMNGTIKKLVAEKGFGFIAREGQEKELFFHSKSLVDVKFDELHEGDELTFDVENTDKGPNAINVHRA